MTTNMTTTKIRSTLYSDIRKALAPSAMAPAISFIRSFPASFLPMDAEVAMAKRRARIPMTGTIIRKFSIIISPLLKYEIVIIPKTGIV